MKKLLRQAKKLFLMYFDRLRGLSMQREFLFEWQRSNFVRGYREYEDAIFDTPKLRDFFSLLSHFGLMRTERLTHSVACMYESKADIWRRRSRRRRPRPAARGPCTRCRS